MEERIQEEGAQQGFTIAPQELTKKYTDIIDAQIWRVLELEKRVEFLNQVIAELGKKEAALQENNKRLRSQLVEADTAPIKDDAKQIIDDSRIG